MCPHTRFDNKKSTTFKALSNEKLSIEYGVGTAKGSYALDTITLGESGISLPNHTIGLVSNTDNILSASEDDTMPSNGILGMGHPSLSMKSGEKPGHLVMGLYQANIISEPIFSIFLNTQSAYGKTGELVLGGLDSTKYTDDIQYVPIVSFDVSKYYVSANLGANKTSTTNGSQETYLYWSVPGQGVSTSSNYSYSTPDLQAFILDTGTTLTYVPESIAKSIVMSLTNNAKTTKWDALEGIYRVSCSLAEKSDLFVEFLISPSETVKSTTPMTIRVPVSELVIPLDDARTPETSTSCMFGIAPAPKGLELTSGDTWILGESTLRSLYTVYDLKQNRFGMAKLATAVNSSSATSNATIATTTTNSDIISNSMTGTPLAQSDTPPTAISNGMILKPSFIFLAKLFTLYFIFYDL
ncbi:hypothetical protein CU098_001211 [Rhizopus stolonifer]|uniref:rhizopuspepsin n=1 Tax=Rhizopus stolonifer TaxID=4846 RepID=A0A367K6D9_RHIST|nr:hypothetical protein CU098_001211 [Rhizopus stolonifer]